MRENLAPAISSTDEVSDISPSPAELLAAFAQREADPVARAASWILRATGENPSREGLLDTPKRFSKAMGELFSGYEGSLESVVGNGVFPAEGNGLVSVRAVEFFSLCEHHLLPFWGRASVAYYPAKSILGLSKIPRILDHFSRRVQVQERITEQVADAVAKIIEPRAIAVRITACHLCMMMRGVQKQGSETVTEAGRRLENLSDHERERLLGAL